MAAILTISDLEKSFISPAGGPVMVLRVPAFEIETGAQVALRGESGSGKTTFLHCIAGIHRADTGSISIAGKPMHGVSEAQRDRLRAAEIGYVFQSFNLLQGLNCLENVMLAMTFGPRRPDRERALQLLERVGMGDKVRHRPRELSIGQQQRVAVARALANKPRLVLADEPTGNLDRANTHAVLDLVTQTCMEEGSALLLVSHDEEVLKRYKDLRDFATINQLEGRA